MPRPDHDAAGLRDVLDQLDRHRGWKVLGFASIGTLCQKELSLDERAVERIRAAKPGMMLRTVLEAETAKELHEQHDKTLGSNVTQRGGSAEYLTARIKRDHPGILARMKAGEFRSVRAAAVEAGIVKVPTAYESALKATAKLSKADKRRLLRALADELGD